MTRGFALVLEDDPIIGFALEDMLLAIGFEHVDMTTTIDEARESVELSSPAVAILDVNIHGERSYVLATLLRSKNVPLVFASGYGDSEHPDELRRTPTVTKPYSLSDVETAIREAVG